MYHSTSQSGCLQLTLLWYQNAAAMSTMLRAAFYIYGIHVMAVMKQQMAVQETNKEAGVLVKAEERAKGRVDRRLYRTYLSAWGPFFAIPLLMVVLATSERGLQVSQGLSECMLIGTGCTRHRSSHLPAHNADLSTQHSSQLGFS